MQHLAEKLSPFIVDACETLYGSTPDANSLNLQPTRKEFEGDITLVVFPFTRLAKKKPEEIAQQMGEFLLKSVDTITAFQVVKGFLNLSVKADYWMNQFSESVLSKDFGQLTPTGESVLVEYSSPNTNKPLHLGHIRNILLGHSVCRVLAARGNKVIKANLINDRGIHICKSMLAWQLWGEGETPESSGLKGDHLVGKYYVLFDKKYKIQVKELIASGLEEDKAKKEAQLLKEAQKMLVEWENGDEATLKLWKTMNDWVYAGFKVSYDRLGVEFDKFYYESDTYSLGKDVLLKGLEMGVLYKKDDGSIWADLRDQKLDDKLLLRGDGTSVYMTQDIGTAYLKYQDYKMNHSVYVVGDEQDYHFKVLFHVLDRLGNDWAKGLHHLSYGMVDLPSGKMKSREGTVVDADDLMDEMKDTARRKTEELGKTEGLSAEELDNLYHNLAMGALKFFLLKVEPKKRLLFNPEESIDFQGNTGPFIQYTYARIQAVKRKATDLGINAKFDTNYALSDDEKPMIVALCGYEEVIKLAGDEMSPALIANYAYELAKTFNKFYHDCTIVDAGAMESSSVRLAIADACGAVIEKAMFLLGVDVPERM
jgi:arginyl-tRNA synthetase